MATSCTEEDTNYLRIILLINDVAPKSVRAYFNSLFPPTSLAAHLHGSYNTLHQLRFIQRVLTLTQWNVIFPPAHICVTSDDFDVTLMICLIRNISGISPPAGGYDTLPKPTDTSKGDDLARIKHYRNCFAHSNDTKMSKTKFDDVWNELSQAVERLGGVDFKQMCNELKTANLDNNCYRDIVLSIRHSQDERVKNLTDIIEQLVERVSETEKVLDDPVPKLIRERFRSIICNWEKEDEMYVETKMSKSLLRLLQKENCVTVIGSSGIGKSVTVRHVALKMLAQGYDILLIKSPDDISRYTVKDKKLLYVIDDFCGKYNIFHGEVENWHGSTDEIELIMSESKLKILSCCRLQVYQNCHFKCLNIFTTCPFNMNTNKYGLTVDEKRLIAQKYIPESCSSGLSDDQIQLYDCFPLLCRMMSGTEESKIMEFLLNPFDVFQREMEKMLLQNDKMNYCTVMILVLFENHLPINLLTQDIDTKTREKFDDVFETFGEQRGTSRYRLKDHLDSLTGTYVSLQEDVYCFAHEKIYEMVYSCCRTEMVSRLLKHCSLTSLSARIGFNCMTQIRDDFSIILPAEKEIVYLERLINEVINENFLDVFGSKQMNDEGFRQILIRYLESLDNYIVSKILQLTYFRTNLVHLMCKLGYQDVLSFCLKMGGKVNACDGIGNTPLHTACIYSHNKIVKELLDARANVNEFKHRGFTPLFAACMSGNVDIVNKLLMKGATSDLCSSRKLLPLILVAEMGQLEIANRLLQHGANANIENNQGETALHKACVNNHEQVVNLLIKSGANLNKTTKSNENALYYACDKQNISIIKLLLSAKADIFKKSDVTKLSPFTLMVQNSRHDIAVFMIHSISDVDVLRNAIIEYFDEDNIECLEYLIVNSSIDFICQLVQGRSILHMSCVKGFISVVRFIIQKGADVNLYSSNGETAIQLATLYSHTDIVDLLITNGADVNTSHPGCYLPLPLHIACFLNNVEIVKILIKGNANVNKRDELTVEAGSKLNCTNFAYEQYRKGDKYGKTDVLPLEIACFNQNVEISKILLEGGANTDLESSYAIDPVLIACFYGNKDILKLLLTYKANVNKCCNIEILCRTSIQCSIEDTKKHSNTDYGISPLHVACMNNNEEIVDILIQHRANILSKCKINPCVFAVLTGKKQIRAKYFNCEVISDMYPLHIACFVGNRNILVKLITEINILNIESRIKLTTQQIVLLQSKFPSYTPNICEEISLTPLQISCLCGHWEICKILVKNRADIYKAIRLSKTIIALFKGEKDSDVGNSEKSKLQETGTIDFILENIPDLDVVDTPFENISNFVFSTEHFRKLFLKVCLEGNIEKMNRIYEKYSTCHVLDTTENRRMQCTLNNDVIDERTIILLKQSLINSKTDNNETPLHLAAKSGDEKMAEYLLQKGADLFCLNKTGETALHCACKANSLKCVILILKFTVENLSDLLNLLTTSNESPLFLAYLQNNRDMMTTLIGYGADINQRCSRQNGTLLFYACKRGQEELVDFLLSHSASTDVYNTDQKTPLYVSCEAGYDDITDKILCYGADVNICSYQGYSPLYFACRRGNNVIVERLLMAGADPNVLSETSVSLLIEACIAGDIRVAKCLLQYGADVNFCHYEGETALHFAFKKCDITMMRTLLDYGAGIQVCMHEREFYLFDAYKNGMLNIASLILEYDDSIDVNAKLKLINTIPEELRTFEAMVNIQTFHFNTIFHQVCLNCSTDDIKTILCKQIVSRENIQNECVYACFHGQLENFHLFIEQCLEKNISINLNICMILAAGKNQFEIVTAILQMKYDVNEQSEQGYTALHAASAEGHESIVQTLLNCPLIEVNIKTTEGYTPLHLCCINGHVTVARILLNNNAFIHAKTKNGQTIIDLACLNKQNNMLKLFYKWNQSEILYLFEQRLSLYLKFYFTKMNDIFSKWLCHFQTGYCIDNTDSVLHFACRFDNEFLVENLIKGRADVNSANLFGETPLLIAINKQNISIVIKLLEADASVNTAATIYERGVGNLFEKTEIEKVVSITPLHIACLGHNHKIVKLLLDRNADCNAKCLVHYTSLDQRKFEEMTPLYISTFKKDLTLTKILLQNAYYPHSCKSLYMYSNVLHRTHLLSLNCDSTDIVRISITPFQMACLLGCHDIVQAFIDHVYADINKLFVVTPKMLSVVMGNYETIEDIMEKNEMTDDDFCSEVTPLVYSCLIQDASMVDILLRHGATVNDTVSVCLLHLIAIRRDIPEISFYLPTKSILTSDCTLSAIALAYLIMNKAIIKSLLSTKFTDLSYECKLNIFHILIVRGCMEHVNIINENKFTVNLNFTAQCFHLAIMSNDLNANDIMEELLLDEHFAINTLRLSYIQFASFISDAEVFRHILKCRERNTIITLSPFLLSFLFNVDPPAHFLSLPRFTNVVSIKFLSWYMCFINTQPETTYNLSDTIVDDMAEEHELKDTSIILLGLPPDSAAEDHKESIFYVYALLGLETCVEYSILSIALFKQHFTVLSKLLLHTDMSHDSILVSRENFVCLQNAQLFCLPSPGKDLVLSPLELYHFNHLDIPNNFLNMSEATLRTGILSAPTIACLNGNIHNLQILASRSVYINKTVNLSLLHIACFLKPNEVTEVSYETVLKFNDICEMTVLHAACLKEYNKPVETMILSNCNVNAVASLSPLHIALLTGKIYMNEGLSIKITKENPKPCKVTAVHILCFKGNKSLLKLLSVSTCNFDMFARDFSTLHFAFLSKNSNVHLTEENYNATSQLTPLHIGCITNNAAIVKILLQKTDSIDLVGSVFPHHIRFKLCSCISRCITDRSHFELTAFHIACLKQNQDSAGALIRAGVNLHIPALLAIELCYSNDKYITTKSTLKPLHIACLVQNIHIASMILSKTAQVNEVCPISLYHVCYFRNTFQRMDNLLRNTKFTDTTLLISPLHLLCLYGDTEGVRVLLDQTANANLLADLNPAYALIYCNNETTVEVHIQSNHSVKKSPLHICAEKGDYEICELLVKHGADSNIRTNIGGFQPWHLALYHGHIDVLRCLLMTPLKIHRGQFLFVFVMYIIRKRWSSYMPSAILKLKSSFILLPFYRQFMIVFGFIKKKRCKKINSEITQNESEVAFSQYELHENLDMNESRENIDDSENDMSESQEYVYEWSSSAEFSESEDNDDESQSDRNCTSMSEEDLSPDEASDRFFK